MKNTLLLLMVSIIVSCASTPAKKPTESGCDYEDGRHNATVYYTNSNTGHSHTYTLEVEVSDCYVTVIYWPSGGWSDDDHITPGEIEDGKAYVKGEKGKTYTVSL